MGAAQAAVAAVVAAVVILIAGAPRGPTPWIGAVAVVAGALLVVAGSLTAASAVRTAAMTAGRLASERAGPSERRRTEREEAEFLARLRSLRARALARTLMSATLFATAWWFAAFAFVAGGRGAAVVLTVALAAFGTLIGSFMMGRLAQAVRLPSPP